MAQAEANGALDAVSENPAPQMPPPEEPLLTMDEVVTREKIEHIVKSKNPDFELVDYTTEPGTQAGDNYMSVMYATDAKVKSKKTGAESTIHIMLKTMPQAVFRQQMINDCQAFVKDVKMYSQVFPDLVAFQKEKGLEGDEIFRGFPECYTTFQDGKSDYLAMENLRYEGYKMGGRIEGLDFDHCEVVMKSLAKLHAISYAKFKGDYDTIMATYPFLEEKMFKSLDKIEDIMKQWIGGSILKVAGIIRDAGDEKGAQTVEAVYKDPDHFWGTMYKLVGSKVPNAVIGHGDSWTNNFLFKYDDKTGKPVSLKFVDFQLSRVCSRCIDMGYFLYSSPSTSIINERKGDLIQIYYDEFQKTLKRLGTEPTETFQEFKQEIEDFRFYGISMGIILLPIVSASSSDVPDMESMTGDMSEEKADAFFGDMMKSNVAAKKLVNLAKYHCANVKFLNKD